MGQLAKFRGSPRQIHSNFAAHRGLRFMTENWDSFSETSDIEGWHCTSKIKRKSFCSFQKYNETHDV